MSRGGDDSDPHLAWALTLLEMVTIVSCVLGSALNSIIIILFIRRRGFRTTSNRLVLNLVIANIFSVMVETSGSVTGLLVPGDSNLCSAWFFLHSMLSSNILLSTLVIGLDQYLAIVTPLHYHNIVNKTKLIGVCLLVWATGSASALVDLFTAPSHSVYCGQAEESSDISSRSHQIATFLHLVVLSSVPLVALIFIHIRIFSSAHTNSVRIRRNSTSSERRPSASLASPLSLQPGLTRSPSLWSKLSSAGQLLYREETRAARVSLVVVTMVGLTWAPEAGLRVMVGVMGQAPPPWLARLRVTLLALYSALSPVMFSLRSRRVQREVRRMLGVRARPRRTRHQRMLDKLKSHSCPHLVLTSCQSFQGGPGMSSPDMAAWRALTDLKTRNLHLNIPNTCYSETDTETTPCITVTPPPSETWQWSVQRKTNNNNGDNGKLSPLNIHDVQL